MISSQPAGPAEFLFNMTIQRDLAGAFGQLDVTVLITGGTQGLGKAMTLALLECGARVAVADLPVTAGECAELVAAAKSSGWADRLYTTDCDVTSFADCVRVVDGTVERFGSLHGLVNNAGVGMQHIGPVLVGTRKRFFEVPEDTWRSAMDVNVNGPFLMAKAAAPRLINQGWGRIVNIVTSTFVMMMDGFSPYGPSKAALESATVIWSQELAADGVTVNALLPGGAAATRMIPSSEIPDRDSLIQPTAMAAPIAWLMSQRSNGVTGRRIIAKDWPLDRLQRERSEDVGAAAGWS